jgi:tetratricopeptide (TPR) repeat protein
MPYARKAADRLEQYLASGPVDPAEAQQVVIAYMNVANRYMLADRLDESIRMSLRTIEIARATNQPLQVGAAEMVVASALRAQGDLEDALRHSAESVRVLEPPPTDERVGRSMVFTTALTRQAAILADAGGVSLDRPDEAEPILERAIAIAERFAAQDASDADSRLRLSAACLQLANLLSTKNPVRALGVHDHALRRLAEVKNNSKARRDEVRALAGSAPILHGLGRHAEARERLENAFALLRLLNLYPAKTVSLGSEADDALRAQANGEADTGDLTHAIETYDQLLDAIVAGKPEPETNLEDATLLSDLYTSMAALDRRAGRADAAASLDAQRLALWEQWERKRPQSAFVRRELDAARSRT